MLVSVFLGFFDVGTVLFEMEICLNEKQASENDRQASSEQMQQGTRASWETLILLPHTFIQFHFQYQ